jgi:hypothetical protein
MMLCRCTGWEMGPSLAKCLASLVLATETFRRVVGSAAISAIGGGLSKNLVSDVHCGINRAALQRIYSASIPHLTLCCSCV